METELLKFIIPILMTGFFSGLLAGLLGIGGGIIIIPVVFYILIDFNYSTDIIMRVAIASSLAVIFITSLSSIYSHYKLNNIDMLIIKKWFTGVIAGSICGALFASFINGDMLIIFFVVIASLIAINMFLDINIVLANDIPEGFFLNINRYEKSVVFSSSLVSLINPYILIQNTEKESAWPYVMRRTV